MIYCEGRNCSRRDQCAYHENFEWKHLRQYLDKSTQGHGSQGIDENGNIVLRQHFTCGDNATGYHNYRALGWRDGQEYKNSEGTICDEVCLSCPHKTLCFCILEQAGMVFKPGDRIRFNCESIKANPEEHKDRLIKNGWNKELFEKYSNGGTTKMNNYERVKLMSVEEMAEEYSKACPPCEVDLYGKARVVKGVEEDMFRHTLKMNTIKWLLQEVNAE